MIPKGGAEALARRGRDGILLVLTAALFIGFVTVGTASAQAASPDPAAAMLDAARQAGARGAASEGLEDLRSLRSRYPDSPLIAASYSLGVDLALSSGDLYLARFYMDRLLGMAPTGADTFRRAQAIASYYYQRKSYAEALPYYRQAVFALEGAGGGVTAADAATVRLRAAELDAYHQGDELEARRFFSAISRADLAPGDQPLYRELRVRLLWSQIKASDLGLADSNVSSLRVDGDDLWVGTWNGGAARYSVSAGRGDPFPSPAFVRSIEVSQGRVWIGTAEGLSWYGKATGRWGQDADFQSPNTRNVQVLRASSNALYAGTLGDGLYRLGDDGWQAVGDDELPGRFVTTLATEPSSGRLLIGTMNLGLILMDPTNGAMQALSEVNPDFDGIQHHDDPPGPGGTRVGRYLR